MAEIVLGIGCAHTPQLHTPAEMWDIRAERDARDGLPLWYKGERLRYAEVLQRREHENLGAQTTMQVREERLRKSYAAIDRLGEMFAASQADVTIIFGNDQGEIFLDDLKPAFTIMGCTEFDNMPRTEEQKKRLPPGIALADVGHIPERRAVYSGHPELARYLTESVMDAGFDVAYSHTQVRADPSRAQTSGLPHSYGFVFKQIMRETLTPAVLIDNNTFFPPNQPKAARCYALGQAIGDAVRAWESGARVALIASGGLSHFVVDEEFDRDIMHAMQKNDFGHLLAYHEGYYQAGSSEIKSWIALGGAISRTSLRGNILDYYALFRTPAGTGSSAAFMYWD